MILLCNQLCQKVNDHILLRTIQAQNIRLLHIALPLIGIRLVIVSPTSPASPPWQKTAPDSGSTTGSVVRLSLSDCSKPGGLLWEGGSCGATGRCLNPDWEHRHSIPHQLPGVVDELCHKIPSCRNHRTSMIEGRVSQCQNSVITILQHRHFDESLDLSTCSPSAFRPSVMSGGVASRYTCISE